MKKFAIVGHPLGHTLSPFIHSALFEKNGVDAVYEIFDCPPEKLTEAKPYLDSLDGYNVTIPHKQAIVGLLDGLDESAEKFGSVNVVASKNGIKIGFNTDVFGFERTLEKLGSPLSAKDGRAPRVCLIGAGGVGKMFGAHCLLNGAKLTAAVRNPENQSEELNAYFARYGKAFRITSISSLENDAENESFDLLVNSTPVGMFPDVSSSPVSKKVVAACKTVFDAVYNPQKTALLKLAEGVGKGVAGGMDMLVWQAAKAHEIWYGATIDAVFSERLIEKCYGRLNAEFASKIYFTGFMASGKSRAARLTSEALGLPYYDTDALIEQKYGKISKIFAERGESGFREIESEALRSIPRGAAVVATGGGALLSENNADFAKATGKIILLDASLTTCVERMKRNSDRPLAANAESLYAARLPRYREIADVVIPETATDAEIVAAAKKLSEIPKIS